METNDSLLSLIAVCCNMVKSASFSQMINREASVTLEITLERKNFRIMISSISTSLNSYICRLRLFKNMQDVLIL